MSDQVKNTDRELWRTCPDDFYADSIHVTEAVGIGINVGGRVIVKTLKQWHTQAEEIERLTEEAETAVGSEAMALSRVIESMGKRHRAAAIATEWWKKRDDAKAESARLQGLLKSTPLCQSCLGNPR